MAQAGPAILRGLTCFEEAIALDPDYALAHASLADALRALAVYGLARPTEVLPRAKAALGRALDLEPNLAEALATQGLIALMHEYDVVAGTATLERALQLNPQLMWARMTSIQCSWPRSMPAWARRTARLNCWSGPPAISIR